MPDFSISLTHSLSLVHDRLGLHADLDVDGGELAHEVEEDVGQVDVLSEPVLSIEVFETFVSAFMSCLVLSLILLHPNS